MATSEDDLVVEIRAYRLKSGQRASFHEALVDGSLAMLHDHGIRVVRFGPSLHDDDSYVLIRAFASIDDRIQQEEAFYGSERWLKEYDDRVMAMIDSYITNVITLSASTVDAMQDQAALPPA